MSCKLGVKYFFSINRPDTHFSPEHFHHPMINTPSSINYHKIHAAATWYFFLVVDYTPIRYIVICKIWTVAIYSDRNTPCLICERFDNVTRRVQFMVHELWRFVRENASVFV